MKTLDLIIIGAGPAGLSAALSAHEKALDYLLLEAEDIAQTIRNYPKGKAFFNKPDESVALTPNGKIPSPTRETVLAHWENTVSNLNINTHEKVIDLKKRKEYFSIKTLKKEYKAKKVILALGNYGQPRYLNLPGEELPHVFHRLSDPENYKNKTCLIIGGGDSAAEAAIALKKSGNTSLISYRKKEFTRLKENNLQAIKELNIPVYFRTNPTKFTPKQTILTDSKSQEKTIKNDFVFILCGSVFPSEFLQKIGLSLNERNEVNYNEETFETKIENLYIIGSLTREKLIPTAIAQGRKVIENLS